MLCSVQMSLLTTHMIFDLIELSYYVAHLYVTFGFGQCLYRYHITSITYAQN